MFYLSSSASDQSCPGQWNLRTSPVSGCTGADYSCRSVFSDDINTGYSKVCARFIGEGVTSPDGFYRSPSLQSTNIIKGNYLDRVSVTHGAPGSRTHIWSFTTGRCPCDSSDRTAAPLPPAEVGDNYFCGRYDELNPIWTGESCTNDSPWCSFHNPPYFSVQLPSATTDKIELQICSDEFAANEPVLVLFAEIFVQ